ncbi:hypothetical protein B0T37_18945 [Chromobacterium violaceum]|nr:hypothetical protein B0T38_19350 [Chromobacterium violaceum]OQS22059.1 hypothetical protein B0T37_18945 [Chromobacterium violaceum]
MNGNSGDYSCQLTADYGYGNTMRFRTSNDDAKRWNPWYTLIHEGHLTGQVAFFAMSAPPLGWLKARGNAVSRTEYAALFAAIGTTYGAGDGSTTFNLPDLRGEFVRGWDDGKGIDNLRGIGTNQGFTIQAHSHAMTAGQGTGGAVGLTWNLVQSGSFVVSGPLQSGVSGDQETRPRNVALLACIKY